MSRSTQNLCVIKGTPEEVYNAFIEPKALEAWQSPGSMTAKVHNFDSSIGYEMSLFYPESETKMKGKTAGKEDRYTARFVELIPNQKIVEAIKFQTTDPAFAGEMIMEIIFFPVEQGTRVSSVFKNIPIGIKLKDNEAGTKSSLEKLAQYVESKNNRTRTHI